MDPLLIALIGMLIVVGGILLFKMHAFLALILAAFAVTVLTPREAVLTNAIRTNAIKIIHVDGSTITVQPIGKQKVVTGQVWLCRSGGKRNVELLGTGRLSELPDPESNALRFSLLPEQDTPIPAEGDWVLHHTALADARAESSMNWGEQVAVGMGNTLTKIAILIAMACIIGKCLMDSGGAERIVLSITQSLGEKRAPVAFIGSGFLLSIPVFFDTVFYLLIPLGKAMRVRTGRNYLLYVLSIVVGGTMAHSLVPPTPGPLFVALEMGVDLGIMILGGICVGLVAVVFGYLWAIFVNSRLDIPLRASEQLSLEDIERIARRKETDLPALLPSLSPILVPVILMGSATIWNMATKDAGTLHPAMATVGSFFEVVGNKNIAMSVAALLGLLLLIRSSLASGTVRKAVQSALSSSAVIILITGAGGAFGHALRQTGIAFSIEEMMSVTSIGLIPMGFLICAVIRTAQGSSTVAMITTVGIIAPIVLAQDLAYNPVYVALAIGCGSKPISWMNDSGFWVISQMSGLTEKEMLKTNTPMTSMMGVAGLGACMLGSLIFPMV